MSPVAVNGLEIEAMEYSVCSPAGMRRARSAQPKPCSQIILPSFATATAMDGAPLRASWLRMDSAIASNWPALACSRQASRRKTHRRILIAYRSPAHVIILRYQIFQFADEANELAQDSSDPKPDDTQNEIFHRAHGHSRGNGSRAANAAARHAARAGNP